MTRGSVHLRVDEQVRYVRGTGTRTALCTVQRTKRSGDMEGVAGDHIHICEI